MITQKDVDELEKTFTTKTDLKESLTELKSDIFNKLDSFVGEVKASREERTVSSHQISELDDRVTKLESLQAN